MPRKAKSPGPSNQGGYQGAGNPGGGGTQPAQAPTGLPYGEHQALVQSQQQAPLPQAGPPVTGAPAPNGAPVAGGNPMQAALEQALQQAPPPEGGLLAPSLRPHEPVTHGLTSGPGAGPEAMGPPPNLLADQLQSIAQDTNDPAMARLAQLARTLSGQNA